MKIFFTILFAFLIFTIQKLQSQTLPFTIELENVSMPGTPVVHSGVFAQYNGKWLFIGGRTNGLHGFTTTTGFPSQYANKNIYVVDPVSGQTWSRNIYLDLTPAQADLFRCAHMNFFQVDNKLYITGGYGIDTTINDFVTFQDLTVIDINGMMNAVISGSSIVPYIKRTTDVRVQVTGGELTKLGDYFYLVGGHKFTGAYDRTHFNQVYTNQIKKFQINESGSTISIVNYSTSTDTIQFHRRDMNLVPAIKPSGELYEILYGGVFIYGRDLPYLNPIYIDANGSTVDFSFEQKMSQYITANMSAFNSTTGDMHTTFFGGTSLYFYNDITHMLEMDTLVPFIDEITTLTKFSNGTSTERLHPLRMPGLLGTNALFILEQSVPHYSNGVIKLNEISGRTFVGYIFGGIRALLPNTTPSYASDRIMKVYLTPPVGIKKNGNEIPSGFSLEQNFPNPFNPVTKIKFDIPSIVNSELSIVNLKIFDMLGKEVATLVNDKLSPGSYSVEFDGTKLSSGVYYYKLQAGNFVETKKMILVK